MSGATNAHLYFDSRERAYSTSREPRGVEFDRLWNGHVDSHRFWGQEHVPLLVRFGQNLSELLAHSEGLTRIVTMARAPQQPVNAFACIVSEALKVVRELQTKRICQRWLLTEELIQDE